MDTEPSSAEEDGKPSNLAVPPSRMASRAGARKSLNPAKGNISLLQSEKTSNSIVKVAFLNLVDLAGSEMAHQHASSERRMEGKNINLSLLHLKEIIMKLSKGEV